MNTSQILAGDCREQLRALPENSVDAIVTDPPYELGFMGKGWDKSGIAYDPIVWSECLRVLKPGGYLLAFGGTRTFHRLTVAIEDAGFEIRDCLSWLYGTGFPKSLNLGDGRGTALKPAWEPITMARKPLVGTVAKNVGEFGTGALNIDDCRIATTDNLNGGAYAATGTIRDDGWGMQRAGAGEYTQPTGRWPANILLDEDAASALDEQSGVSKSTGGKFSGSNALGQDTGWNAHANRPVAINRPTDSGGASRFFYVAKASKSERNAGCENLPDRTAGEATDREDGSAGLNSPRAGAGRTSGNKNHHPTVKPTALMGWLIRLVTPLGGTVLDPFMGSGSTGVAAQCEGRHFIGIDLTPEYVEIAEARISHAAEAK